MKSLIIGAGEVGSSLKRILEMFYEVVIRDIEPEKEPTKGVKVLHICYPEIPNFVDVTKKYIQDYTPEMTIIHSSVSVGTTRKCGGSVVYSPIRGRHSQGGLHLEMKSFPKFVASADLLMQDKARDYFDRCSWKVIASGWPDDLEYLKLMSNVHMGLEIAWRQEIERMMKEFGINPYIYERWEDTYRDGYLSLGQFNLVRSLMKPDPIGGHCILPCTEILKAQFPSKALDFILESNEKRKQELA